MTISAILRGKMNIKIFRNGTPSHRPHRHFLAAPLFAVLVIFPLLRATPASVLPSLVDHAAADESVLKQTTVFPDGTVGLPGEKGILVTTGETAALTDGSALVAAKGFATVRVGPYLLRGFAGAYHVTMHGDQMTVAALTTPVMVTKNREQIAVPAGTQLRSVDLAPASEDWIAWSASRKRNPLPLAFLTEQIALAGQLLEAAPSLLPEPSSESPSEPLPLLRLPEAERRAHLVWLQESIAHLRYLLEAGDPEALHLFLQRIRPSLTQQNEGVLTVFAQLLEGASANAANQRELLSIFVEDADACVLASLHPLTRDIAWLLSCHLPISQRADRLFALPLADNAAHALQASAVDAWEQDVTAMARKNAQPAFAIALLTALEPVLVREFERGYPERVQRYASALLRLTEDYDAVLPPSVQSMRKTLRTLGAVSLHDAPAPIADTPSTTSSHASILNQDALVQTASAALRSVGANFTVETRVQAVAENRVSVSGIILSDGKSDATYAFIYDLQSKTISQLMRNDQILPYALSWDAFVQWAAGEQVP